MDNINKPWLIAHRGARDERPENTRAAIQRALCYPVDGVELDIQMSADGIPVVYHDRTLRRVAGIGKRISEMAFSDLQAIDWGRWFHADYSGEKVLTLEKALHHLQKCPQVLIEIKSRTPERESGHSRRLAEKIAAILSQSHHSGIKDKCLLLSFDEGVLETARKAAPGLRYIFNLSENGNMPSGSYCHLWAVCVRISRLSDLIVRRAKKKGLRVFTYTCNGPRQVKKALRMGVDAILSDRPGWLTRYLERHVRGK